MYFEEGFRLFSVVLCPGESHAPVIRNSDALQCFGSDCCHCRRRTLSAFSLLCSLERQFSGLACVSVAKGVDEGVGCMYIYDCGFGGDVPYGTA